MFWGDRVSQHEDVSRRRNLASRITWCFALWCGGSALLLIVKLIVVVLHYCWDGRPAFLFSCVVFSFVFFKFVLEYGKGTRRLFFVVTYVLYYCSKKRRLLSVTALLAIFQFYLLSFSRGNVLLRRCFLTWNKNKQKTRKQKKYDKKKYQWW